MDKDETDEKRRLLVSAREGDIMVRVLDIPEADYQCVVVNRGWYEKALLEGDLILFAERSDPEMGDIVLIEEEGETRLGIASNYGFLETAIGRRPLEASERIIGVGIALARKLSSGAK
jgi:hypothetical protein